MFKNFGQSRQQPHQPQPLVDQVAAGGFGVNANSNSNTGPNSFNFGSKPAASSASILANLKASTGNGGFASNGGGFPSGGGGFSSGGGGSILLQLTIGQFRKDGWFGLDSIGLD